MAVCGAGAPLTWPARLDAHMVFLAKSLNAARRHFTAILTGIEKRGGICAKACPGEREKTRALFAGVGNVYAEV